LVETGLDERKLTLKFGIIVPTRMEADSFRAVFEFRREDDISAQLKLYRENRKGGRRVIMARCGVGKVNSAAAAQMLISEYGAEGLIIAGVAGASDPRLEVGDVAISKDAVQWDVGATDLGFKPGHIPFYRRLFPADRKLIDRARRAARRTTRGSEPKRFRTWVGRVMTADRFVGDRRQIRQLHREFGGLCVEMEGAAAGQVALLNKIPFVIVRSICDKGDGGDFAKNVHLAATRAAGVVREMITTR
jgi:adenosylhomocysteine nucleosidase